MRHGGYEQVGYLTAEGGHTLQGTGGGTPVRVGASRWRRKPQAVHECAGCLPQFDAHLETWDLYLQVGDEEEQCQTPGLGRHLGRLMLCFWQHTQPAGAQGEP